MPPCSLGIFSDFLKEQNEQLQEELQKLNEELSYAKDKLELMKQHESEKVIYAEKNSELHKEIQSLQERLKEFADLVREKDEESQAFNKQIEQLKDDV